MSRYEALVERYLDGEETPEEAEELSRLVLEDPARAGSLYDAVMLEANLHEIYAGVAAIQDAPRVRSFRLTPRLVAACTIAVFMLAGLAVLLVQGTPAPARLPQPVPAAPQPSAPPTPEAPVRDHGSKREEIEREYRKGLREVERKRLEGKNGESDKKLREIEREREKQLRELQRREADN